MLEEITDILAGLGDMLEQKLADPAIAFLVGVAAWALWPTPVDTIILTLLIVSIHYKLSGKKPASPEEIREKIGELRGGETVLIIAGVLLTALGVYLLLGEYVRIPWQMHVILAGVFLVILGIFLGEKSE